MPYPTIKDLPDRIKHVLPVRAQEIYRTTFNTAHGQYGDEIRAIKIAWSAVKKSYKKNKEGKWVQK